MSPHCTFHSVFLLVSNGFVVGDLIIEKYEEFCIIRPKKLAVVPL